MGDMEAGRELDALVAEKVFGWIGYPNGYTTLDFSTEIAAAWQVIQRLIQLGIRHPMVRYDSERTEGSARWTVAFVSADGKEGCRGDAATAPLAICRAALKAVSLLPTEERTANG